MWSGQRAVGLGLVDALGGVTRAVQLAKQAAGLAADEAVRVLEVSRAKVGAAWWGGVEVGRRWGGRQRLGGRRAGC